MNLNKIFFINNTLNVSVVHWNNSDENVHLKNAVLSNRERNILPLKYIESAAISEISTVNLLGYTMWDN